MFFVGGSPRKRAAWEAFSLFFQWYPVGVAVDAARKDQHALDKSPNCANAAAKVKQNLRHPAPGVPKIEVVNAPAAEKDAQQTGCQL